MLEAQSKDKHRKENIANKTLMISHPLSGKKERTLCHFLFVINIVVFTDCLVSSHLTPRPERERRGEVNGEEWQGAVSGGRVD